MALSLSKAQRSLCEQVLRSSTTERRVAQRAQGLLLLADGVTAGDTAMLLGVDLRTVFKWKLRVTLPDLDLLLTDAPRSGRPISLFLKRTPRVSSPKRVVRPRT